jgi:hypothetical protein
VRKAAEELPVTDAAGAVLGAASKNTPQSQATMPSISASSSAVIYLLKWSVGAVAGVGVGWVWVMSNVWGCGRNHHVDEL